MIATPGEIVGAVRGTFLKRSVGPDAVLLDVPAARRRRRRRAILPDGAQADRMSAVLRERELDRRLVGQVQEDRVATGRMVEAAAP